MMRSMGRIVQTLALVGVVGLGAGSPTADAQCPGRCEGASCVGTCEGDFNRDSQVTVDEILTAVNNALGECPSTLTTPQQLVANVAVQRLTLDQQAGRPDCETGLLCSSFQDVKGSTVGPIDVDRPSVLIVTFTALYNVDKVRASCCTPYIQERLGMSTNEQPYEEVHLTGGLYIEETGTHFALQRAIPVGAGRHTVRIQHRFAAAPGDSYSAFSLSSSIMRVEVLESCALVPVCGNGVLEPGEVCDVAPGDTACPGTCRTDCKCPE